MKLIPDPKEIPKQKFYNILKMNKNWDVIKPVDLAKSWKMDEETNK